MRISREPKKNLSSRLKRAKKKLRKVGASGKSLDQVFRTRKIGSRRPKKLPSGMVVSLGKKESPKKVASKIRKVASRSKRIDWNKYVGKLTFPADGRTYQRKVRDEWAK